jgi:signal transduction histidine kinase
VSVRSDGTEASDVVVFVHNDGIVSPEVMPVLFEPFRGTARQQTTRGLGLGLFITRQIVTAHGGAIDVMSTQDEGTTFRVRLPRVPPSETHSAVRP